MANFIGYFSLCLNMPCPNIAFPTLPCTDSCLLKLVVRPRKIILFFRVQLYCVYLPITKHFVNSKFWNFEKTWPYFQKKTFNIKKNFKNQVLKKPKCYNISFFKNDKRKTYKSYSRLTMVLVNQPVTVTPTVSQFRQKTFFVFHPSQKFYPCRILRGINFYEI